MFYMSYFPLRREKESVRYNKLVQSGIELKCHRYDVAGM